MIFLIFTISEISRVVHCLQLVFGDCPLLYEEQCNPQLVKFLLFTPATSGETIHPFYPKLPENYNILTPTKVVIHGYGGLSIDIATRNVSKAYQDIGYNVILVDWEYLASIPCYPTAYLNTWHVGQCLAILLVNLIPLGISPGYLHLIGFSLGAHIAGFAGMQMKRIGLPVKRITGLDPALPFFATLKTDWKLDPTDADFVDVIHTSAGSFGKIEAAGHVDFYVNGGYLQPFCHNATRMSFCQCTLTTKTGNKRDITCLPHLIFLFPILCFGLYFDPPLCSHLMAGLYFAESIKSDRFFIGRECENFINYFLGICFSRQRAVMGEKDQRDFLCGNSNFTAIFPKLVISLFIFSIINKILR